MTEEYIKVKICYYINEDTGKKVFDTDEMTEEFQRKLEELK